MHRQEDELKDVHIPEAAIYKRAPKGEGFSVRSKTDIASAWAAHRKGEGAPEPKQPMAEARAKPEDRLAQLIGPVGPETAAEGEPPPQRAPVNPLERLMRSKPGGRAKPPPRSAQPSGPGRGRGGVVKQSAEERKPFAPAKRRFSPSGVTQSIDVDELRAELGIGSKPQGEEKATPSQAKQKAVALQAFIKRIIRTTLHQQCLEIVLRRRLTLLTPSRLAQEAACRDKEARRVLGDWKSGGLIVPRGEEYGEPEYDFSPSRSDLATIKDYMTLWENPEWHNKLLGWIIQEEGTR
ncbi:unnamed protein product [marine sediment metagenome]|uniref:Uncharacterized protein n=1 Tax=marine sediment metagenome TaxID=412755 RepID=X0SC09_9ZZZZ